ncbi:MAG TPA: SIS domain-containing protein [Gammaproteobacteria bacterium]|nr:SIS domain-containing protein [Gammaproteobacteria bacterium]HQZ88001.1 SIS domain-containing protein [Gammaproteobacteria bacterium]HRA42909.1 SIS domain-containing protein [Gammaproteobacteria bacterium]
MKFSSEQISKCVEKARDQWLDAIELKKQCLTGSYLNTLVSMAEVAVRAMAKGGKLMLCGNGGSAADAQHLAAELLVRLRSHTNRDAIPALSLVLDTSTITACANDYGYECLFERMVNGLGRPEDVLLGLTTSGRSVNVIRALKAARERGIATLGFLGGDGGQTIQECDLSIIVPSSDPNRVQEIHITLGHILMDLIEGLMIEKEHVKRH